MAMKWPSARIVRRHLEDDVGVGRHDLDIATLGILRVGEGSSWPVTSPWRAGCEDEEIMPVKMYWVRCDGRIIDYETD
jgi:hypothetical protein